MASAPAATSFTLCGKKPPGTTGTEIKGGVLVNAFPLKINKNTPLYKYDLRVIANFAHGKCREITKQLRDDFSEVTRKDLLTRILRNLQADEAEFFQGQLYHDRAACAYSLSKLDIPDKEAGKVFTKPGDYVSNVGGSSVDNITITIKECKDNFQATTNTLDNLFKEFANIAVAQEAYTNPDTFTVYGNDVYVTNPASAGFQDADAPPLPGMAVALPVIKKSVKIVEGPTQGKPTAVMLVDVGKSPIHLPGPLLEKIKSIVNEGARRGVNVDIVREMRGSKIIKALKMLEVVPSYRPGSRSIIIKSIANSADQEIIPDLKISVKDYYKQKLKIVLKFPNYPCVRDIRGNCYPVEVLEVLDLQRVRKSQEIPSQSEKIIRASATLPSLRREQTKKAFKALNLENSQLMNSAGLAVQNEMITVPARSLTLPRIVYGQAKFENVAFGKWRFSNGVRFFIPATIEKWAVWANVEERSLQTVGQFCDQIVSRAQARGIKLTLPEKTQIDSRNLAKHFTDAEAAGVKFIFMVSEDYEEAHKELKYLEVKHKISTQEVRISVARKAVERNQVVTFDNIIMKMNIKNRGLNHDVQFPSAPINALISNNSRLIIGIEMSHPAPGGIRDHSASVIGWSANCLQHPSMYTGNFVYCEPRQAEPDLTPVFKQIIGRLMKYRKDNIANIDIFMGGVSEGQLPRQARNAVKQCLEVCALVKLAPKVMLVAVAMEHSERFYNVRIEGDRAGQQNIQPGTVIDKQIVQSSRSEFFLAAHSPVQGTSSVPKYTVCVDMSGRKMDDIQLQVYGLCHLHQYSLMTTARPTPLYAAGDYAQRGADILPFIANNELTDGQWSIESLNQCSYQRTVLDNARMA